MGIVDFFRKRRVLYEVRGMIQNQGKTYLSICGSINQTLKENSSQSSLERFLFKINEGSKDSHKLSWINLNKLNKINGESSLKIDM